MWRSRTNETASSTLYFRLSAALFVTLTAIVFMTFRHYGMSWDEVLQYEYGEKVLRYYTSFLSDRSSMAAGDLSNYGGFFEILAVLATRILPFGVYETRHLITAICGVAGVFAAWKIARRLAGPAAGFWTAFLLALYPPYFGHMFINSKDVPFAVGYAWSLYYLLAALREFPNLTSKTSIKLGIAIGLTMATRVGGLVLLCYVSLFFFVCLLQFCWRNRASVASIAPIVGKTFLGVATAGVIAYVAMLLFWPYALSRPFIRPFIALNWLSHVGGGTSEPGYIVRHLFFKLPEVILILMAIGAFLGIRTLLSERTRPNFPSALPYAVLVFSVAFPIVYAALARPYLYDEIRHFLFVIPPMFCLAGITLSQTLWIVHDRPLPFWRKVAIAAFGLYFLLHVHLLVQLHPYEYTYYNRLIGGVHGAFQEGYDTDYWATSYKEGTQRLEQYFRNRDGTNFEKIKYKILGGPGEWCASYYFPPNFVLVYEASGADAYLTTTRYGSENLHNGQEVVNVGRFEVPFVIGKILPPSGN